MRRDAGYTFFELMIVIIVLSALVVVLSINLGPRLVTLDIDHVASRVAASVKRIQREALRGDPASPVYNSQKDTYNFDLASALPSRHPGILVDTRAPASTNNCAGQCANAICISGQQYCFKSVTTLEFEPNSGRLADNFAFFIKSDARKLAVLVSRNGSIDIAELVNQQWRSRTDLQKLQ
jgi:type II secretory pathway pseudopilin PulG